MKTEWDSELYKIHRKDFAALYSATDGASAREFVLKTHSLIEQCVRGEFAISRLILYFINYGVSPLTQCEIIEYVRGEQAWHQMHLERSSVFR